MTIAIIYLWEYNQDLPLIYELSFVNSLDKDGGMLEQNNCDSHTAKQTLRHCVDIYIYRHVVRCKHMVEICLSYLVFYA